MHHPTDRIAHTTALFTPVVEHWLKREIAQWVHPMKDRSDDPSHHERTLLQRGYISLLTKHRNTISKHTRLKGTLFNKIRQYRERERNVLFNDALNTFYLRLYGVRHMVKDHSDSEKGNPLPPHRLLLSISSKGSFICTIPQTG